MKLSRYCSFLSTTGHRLAYITKDISIVEKFYSTISFPSTVIENLRTIDKPLCWTLTSDLQLVYMPSKKDSISKQCRR